MYFLPFTVDGGAVLGTTYSTTQFFYSENSTRRVSSAHFFTEEETDGWKGCNLPRSHSK